MNFEYKVSVIIPIYNSEQSITATLDSLTNQIFPLADLEVLMIDDGSTDGSADICRKYAEKHPSFKLYQKENDGVSSARNFGITRAKGKYLMYLDADDTYSSETVKNVYLFFEKHYDEIDVATFSIIRYKLPSEEIQPSHMRYKILTHTGIYDLNDLKNIYAVQTTMNICVKNRQDNNVLFDENLATCEDQNYILSNLSDKMKIGYCREAGYNYYKHSSSATSERLFPHFAFDSEMSCYEGWFSQYEGKQIPQYVQAMVFYNLVWKNSSNLMYPWHLEGDAFTSEFRRVIKLLNKIDTEVIVAHPELNNFRKHYFITLKENNTVYPFVTDKGVFLIDSENSAVIYYCKRLEIALTKIRFIGGELEIVGHLKSPIFNYLDQPKIYVRENQKMKKDPLSLKLSAYSYYNNCKVKTNNLWAFRYRTSIQSTQTIDFVVDIDGILCNTKLNPKRWTPFYEFRRTSYVLQNLQLELQDNKILAKPIREEQFWQERERANAAYTKDVRGYNLRECCKKYAHKRIWIYSDCDAVDCDNAFYQFLNDYRKNDGIERYFVMHSDFHRIQPHVDDSMMKCLVPFGSVHHKELFLNCEKIITSQYKTAYYMPFDEEEYQNYSDLLNYEVIYLQHGVKHLSSPWIFSPERMMVDKVVISTPFERDNLLGNYGWREDQLIETGMPRFDYIHREALPKNRILFAPSWRRYLYNDQIEGGEVVRKSYERKWITSAFYRSIMDFANNPKLHHLLEAHDLYLDLKLHPLFFRPYGKFMNFDSDRVQLADNSVEISDYKMFITDISSYVFDFAYLCRPVHYFIPDEIELKSWMHVYRNFDLPMDQAFGEVSYTPESAVDAISRAVESDFKVADPYGQRMKNFFFPMANCCEHLYEYLISEEKEDC